MANYLRILDTLRKAKDREAIKELRSIKDEMSATKKRGWDLGLALDAVEESFTPLRIGLDIHGVIDSKPKFFSKYSIRLRAIGHTVYIITGAKITPKLIEKLRNYGMEWDYLLSITDYHVAKKITAVRFDDNGDPWMDQDTWDATKAHICKENKIDILIDDSNIYGKYINKISPDTVYLQIKSYK